MPIKVLMVCLGNICRSPTAEGVLRAQAAKLGLSENVEVDSAGTSAWHIGKAPDPRSQKHALKRGVDISGCKARQVLAQDFCAFDYIFAMDKSNLEFLKALEPKGSKCHLGLYLEYCNKGSIREVPDPYYGDSEDFEAVLNLVEQASVAFLKQLAHQHGWRYQ